MSCGDPCPICKTALVDQQCCETCGSLEGVDARRAPKRRHRSLKGAHALQSERRPPRHLPRGSKFPGGGQATPARKLVFVEDDDVDEAAGLALLALARCA